MQSLIESLESRTLLSVATPPAITTLFTEGKVVIADGKAVAKIDASGLKTIGADLKAAKLLKADAVAIKTLVKGDAATGKLLANKVASTEKVIGAEAKKLEGDGNALTAAEGAKKPNAKLIAKLTAAVTAVKTVLSTLASNDSTALSNDISAFQSTVDIDSSALTNSSQMMLDGAISSYQSSLATSLGTTELGGAISNALMTDVPVVVALY